MFDACSRQVYGGFTAAHESVIEFVAQTRRRECENKKKGPASRRRGEAEKKVLLLPSSYEEWNGPYPV
jgi:hypothetical protein